MNKRGFTLIELMIVVAILGILATVVVTVLNPVQQIQKGHDFKRKSDLSTIQTALEQYRHDQSAYPIVTGTPYIIGSCGSAFTSPDGTINYLSKIPCDPISSTAYNAANYYYYSNGTTYTLAACLENAQDTDGTTIAPTPAPSGSCSTYYVVNNQ